MDLGDRAILHVFELIDVVIKFYYALPAAPL